MKRRLRWINVTNFAWATVVSLFAVWCMNAFVAERTWPTWLIHTLPQVGYALFPFALLVAALIKKRWKVAVLALVLLALFPFLFLGFVWGRPLDPLDGDMTILTYNIHGGESPLPQVEATIRAIGADVVCLQETGDIARPGMVAAMASRLGYEHVIVDGDMALLSKFPIKQKETVPFEGNSSNRYGVEATIDFHGKAVTVVSVHLLPMLLDYVFREKTPNGIDMMRWTSRNGIVQAKTLSGRYHDWPNPVIVAGDHNFNPNGVRYRTMDEEFDDAFARVGRGFGYTIKAGVPTMRLDYVWTRMCDPVACDPYPSTASDHMPLVARVRF